MMKKTYHTGDTIEYRGYTFKMEEDYISVYDKYGNYLKQSCSRSHGTLSDLKMYVDKIIKKYGG